MKGRRACAAALLAGAVLVGAGGAVGCRGRSHHDARPVAASATTLLTLEVAGREATVDLAKLPSEMREGEAVVPLAAIWAEGGLAPRETLVFDFEGDDGFRPTSKPKCPALVPGDKLAYGHVVTSSRLLRWDDRAALPRCYSVRLLRRVIARVP